MALIHYGPIASDVRGSMGGTVFARNRSGAYMRARVVPVNPQSVRQMNVRNNLATLQSAFRDTLTTAQRAGWAACAALTTRKNKLGLGITITAQNLYIAINSIVLAAGQTRIDDAPTPPAGIDTPVMTYTGTTAAGIKLATQSPAQALGDILQTQISAAVNPTVNFYKGPWPVTVYNVGVLTPPVALLAPASVAIGNRFFVRSRLVTADGHISIAQPAILDITV